MNEHEFLNADKSNLALQTLYFTDSLKNFNDIAVHSKMMLELIAKRILGQPKVIPTVYLTDGDFSPPVDEVVAIRAMVMSTQTTPVVITVNGIIPMLVSTVPTQIVTGPISSVTVGNTVPGNPVYVQYLDERAALLSNTSTQDDVAVNGTVSLTGSLVPQLGWNKNLGTYSVTFAASVAAGTIETVSVPIPSGVQKDALYLVSVNNPTALGTSVTVTFNSGMTFGGDTTEYSEVTSVDVASGAIKSYLVQGWLLGDADAQISVSNDAAASATGGIVEFEVTMV